jgi:hypothetical protein
MNSRLFVLSELLPLTGAWVGDQRGIFLSIQEIAGLMPQVEEKHQAGLRVQEVTAAAELSAELTQALLQTDILHDRAIRAVYFGLTANIEDLRSLEPPRDEEANQLEQLRDRLLPDRLDFVQRSYPEETGNAARMLEQLTPRMRELLRSIPMKQGTLLDSVLRWGALGARLGDLERQRSLVVTTPPDQPSEYEARLALAQVIDLVLTVLTMSKAPAASIAAIRNPVLEAIGAAERRAASTVKSGTAATSGSTAAAASSPNAAPEATATSPAG